MKKLESSLKNMVIVLTGVTVVAGALLGYVNELTKEPIAQANAKALSDAIASRPAVTNAIAIPCIPLGIFTKLNCSRIPANNTIAKAKPRAVEKA